MSAGPHRDATPSRQGATWRWLRSPYWLLAIATLCWSGNFIVGRAVHADIPPVALAFWRWAIALLVLIPFALRPFWAHRRTLARHWRLLVVLAVTGIFIFHVCVYIALQSTTATNGALIQATTPIVIPAIALLLDRQPLTRRQALGIALSLFGVVTIVLRGDFDSLAALQFTPGDLWMLLSVPMWSLYTVLLRRLPPELPRMAMLLAIVPIGLIVMAPWYAWELRTVGGFAVTASTLLSIAYVAVFASFVAYICWNNGVAAVGANRSGLFMHLMPVFTTLLAVVILGEILRPFHFAGIALIATGLVLTTTSANVEPRPARRI